MKYEIKADTLEIITKGDIIGEDNENFIYRDVKTEIEDGDFMTTPGIYNWVFDDKTGDIARNPEAEGAIKKFATVEKIKQDLPDWEYITMCGTEEEKAKLEQDITAIKQSVEAVVKPKEPVKR